ncbi:bone morphogenetic protein receptor type-1B isoform X1 [Hydra vulgaris]|uniref:bone morphogenetic protein receptor type-1B isoform X1 n=1 Tax=Hydra vulgaris TaxID=6087 RepID=UPI001F5FBDFB|nr:bone morphogenetic protein receptor type-1B [Hydra vulgaris]
MKANHQLSFLFFYSLLYQKILFGLECFCNSDCPVGSPNETCYTSYKCFAAIEYLEGTTTQVYQYGCTPPEFEGGIFQCRQKHIPHQVPMVFKCCDDQPRCNENLTLEIPIEEQQKYEKNLKRRNMVQSQQVGLVVSVLLILLVFSLYSTHFYLSTLENLKKPNNSSNVKSPDDKSENSTCNSGFTGFNSGFTGFKSRLVQRSFAKDISMVKVVGRGRFSVVYIGLYQDQTLAVKIVDESDEYSWQREQHFYKNQNLGHENILGFIGADIVERDTVDRFLITQYHPFGSLYNFLQNHSFDLPIFFHLLYSSVCGICYLHDPISGFHGKPAIAHRDISSKNILVKDNLQCCISDFALAVEENPGEFDLVPSKAKIPNPRYMAPEVLENPSSCNKSVFFYQKADMYSFSLVMWEILLRYEIKGVAEPYRLPFEEYVGFNPSINQMNDIVNVKKLKPVIAKKYILDSKVRSIIKSMQRTMLHSALSRSSSRRLKIDLYKCMQEIAKLTEIGGSNNNS